MPRRRNKKVRSKRPGLTTAPSGPDTVRTDDWNITWGKCTGEQLRREPPCENMLLREPADPYPQTPHWQCVCPVEEASPNRQGGRVSGVQRFASGGRAGRSRLGHPIKKR